MSLSEVNETSIGVALVRAMESQRSDRLFNDPYAQEFVAASPEYLARRAAEASRNPGIRQLGASLTAHVVVRTRFYDMYLLDACAAGCTQVVLLAAGLDARAYRLDFPSAVRVFEVDQPAVLAFKARVLSQHEPRVPRTAVEADLAADWTPVLERAGFDRTQRTAWLIEGLLIYLTSAEASLLLDTVTRLSAPGSQVSFEESLATQVPGTVERMRVAGQAPQIASLWKGGLGQPAGPYLSARGWSTRTFDRAALSASYNRPDPSRLPGGYLIGVRG